MFVNPHLYQGDTEIYSLTERSGVRVQKRKLGILEYFRYFDNFETIIALIALEVIMPTLREITLKLRYRDLDIRSAYSLLSSRGKKTWND